MKYMLEKCLQSLSICAKLDAIETFEKGFWEYHDNERMKNNGKIRS